MAGRMTVLGERGESGEEYRDLTDAEHEGDFLARMKVAADKYGMTVEQWRALPLAEQLRLITASAKLDPNEGGVYG